MQCGQWGEINFEGEFLKIIAQSFFLEISMIHTFRQRMMKKLMKKSLENAVGAYIYLNRNAF